MTRGLSRKDIFGILILCFLLSVPLFLFAMPDGLDEVYYHNWICDMICFLISFAVLIGMYAKGRIDIFSPVVFVSVIYILMFFIAPVYQIAVGETSIFGVTDLFDYGVKGSIVALLGFLSFCAVYMRRYQKIPENRGEGSVGRLSAEARRNLSKWVLLAWTLDFVLGLTIVAATQGFSISYILTFGMMGEAEVFETTSTTLGFIGQFTRSIVSLYLIYFCVSDKKVMKGILFVLTAGLEVINGFRYMIVILICGLFYLYHMLRLGYAPAKIYRLAKVAFAGTYDDETILKWLKTFYRRFFAQQFKRSCLPDGPKVGTVSVSPRGDLRMPSDASRALWQTELDRICDCLV